MTKRAAELTLNSTVVLYFVPLYLKLTLTVLFSGVIVSAKVTVKLETLSALLPSSNNTFVVKVNGSNFSPWL